MPKQKNKKEPIAKKGLVICHIGRGKGKTTAAIGIAIRASGAGLNVAILQFVKAKKRPQGEKREPGEWPVSSEITFFESITIPKTLGRIDTEQLGAGFVGILGDQKDRSVHIKAALQGLGLARSILHSGKYELVILDELMSALDLKLIEIQDVISLIQQKPEHVHVVITGHKAYKKISDVCDTVTEMKMLKHAYYQGVLAQKGIDF